MFGEVYKVQQKLNNSFNKRLKIRNPQGITLTVAGEHSANDYYSSFEGTNYALADILINGYGGQRPRPFMFLAREKLKNDPAARKRCSQFLKMSILKPSKSVAAEGGMWVNWDNYGSWVCALIHEWLMDGTLNLAPLKEETQEKRAAAGHGTEPPLYATGELAKMITYVLR